MFLKSNEKRNKELCLSFLTIIKILKTLAEITSPTLLMSILLNEIKHDRRDTKSMTKHTNNADIRPLTVYIRNHRFLAQML